MDWDTFYAQFSTGQIPVPCINHLNQSSVQANGASHPAVQHPPQEGASSGAIPNAPIASGAGIKNVYNFNAPVLLGGQGGNQGVGQPLPMYVNIHGGYVNGGNANGGNLAPNHSGNVQNNHYGGNNFAIYAPPPNPPPTPAPTLDAAPDAAPASKPCEYPGCTNSVNHPGPRVRKCESHLVSRVGRGRAARMAACRAAGLNPCRGCTSGRPQRVPGSLCWKCHHNRLNKRPGGCPGCLWEACPRYPGQL